MVGILHGTIPIKNLSSDYKNHRELYQWRFTLVNLYSSIINEKRLHKEKYTPHQYLLNDNEGRGHPILFTGNYLKTCTQFIKLSPQTFKQLNIFQPPSVQTYYYTCNPWPHKVKIYQHIYELCTKNSQGFGPCLSLGTQTDL